MFQKFVKACNGRNKFLVGEKSRTEVFVMKPEYLLFEDVLLAGRLIKWCTMQRCEFYRLRRPSHSASFTGFMEKLPFILNPFDTSQR